MLLRLVELSLRWRWWVIGLFLLLAAAAVPGVLRLASDNSPEAFFVRDATELARYRRFQMDFGRDRVVRLGLTGPRLWSHEGLAWLGELEQRAERLPGVFAVGGLYRHHHQRFERWPPDDPEAFRVEVLQDPLDLEVGWVDGSGSAASLLIAFYNLPLDQERGLLTQLEGMLAEAPPGIETTIAGLPLIQRALDSEQRRFGRRLFPILFVVATALLLAVLRRPWEVARLLMLVAVPLMATLGTMGYLRASLNVVNILLAPLLFVISLATAVHVLLRFRAARRRIAPRGAGAHKPDDSAGAAVLACYREKAWPVFWAGVTTMAGFGSLVVSGVPAVASLGFWSGVGIALMTLAALTFYPALLAVDRRQPSAGRRYDRTVQRLGGRLAGWAVGRRRRLGWLFGATAVLLLAGLPRLERESNVLSYFPEEHPVRRQLAALEDKGIAIVAADLVLSPRPPADAASGEPASAGSPASAGGPVSAGGTESQAERPAPFATEADLDRLTVLTRRLRGHPQVLGAVSAGDLLASARYWDQMARSSRAEEGETLERLLKQPDIRSLMASLRSRDGSRARVVVMIPMLGFEELEPVLTSSVTTAQGLFPKLDVELTGRYPLVLAAQRSLLETIALSLSLTLLVVAVVFRLALGDGRLALTALVPNLWPVALVLGAMGWLGVPVDSSTLIIAAVVLGLAVDDTFHTFGRRRRLLIRRGAAAGRSNAAAGPSPPSPRRIIGAIAPAHLLSSGLLILGFGICASSTFVPIARFGMVAALGIAGALAADLLLVPALLAGFTPAPAVGEDGAERTGSLPPAGPPTR